MDKEKLDFYFKVTNMYIDNAKSYIQISLGALVLPVFFLKEITGQDHNPAQINWLLITSWLCFLFAIGAGLLYQYMAVKFMHYIAGENVWYRVPKWMVQSPGYIYGPMVVSFYLGALAFVVYAGLLMNRISDFTGP